jgi:hypothetical protein
MEVSTITCSLCKGLNLLVYDKKLVNVKNITPSEDKIRKFPHERTDRTVNKNAARIAGKEGRRKKNRNKEKIKIKDKRKMERKKETKNMKKKRRNANFS